MAGGQDLKIVNPNATPDVFQEMISGSGTLGEATAHAADALNALDALTGQAMTDVLQKGADSTQATTNVTAELLRQNQQMRQQLQAASTRKAELNRLPKLITNVAGFFDDDFSIEAQEARERQAAMGIDANNATMQGVVALSEMQQKLYQQQLKQVELNAELGGNKINRSLALYKQVQDDQDRALDIQLKMNAEGRAVEAHSLSQASGKLSMQLALNEENRASIRHNQQQREYGYQIMSDAEIEQAAATGDASAIKEQRQRLAVQQSLEASALALIDNKNTLGASKKKEALETMNPHQLVSLAKMAEDNGGQTVIPTEYGDVPVTSRELSAALTVVKANTDAATQQLGVEAGYQANIEYGGNAILEDSVSISNALGGAYSIALKRNIDQTAAQVESLMQIGDMKGASEAVTAGLKKVEDFKATYIASLPESQRGAARGVFDGMPVNREQWLSYMSGSAMSGALNKPGPGEAGATAFVLSGNDTLYSEIFQPIVDAQNALLLEARGRPAGIDSEGNFDAGTTGTAAKNQQIWQQAVAAGGPQALAKFQGQRDLRAVDYVLKTLEKSNPQVFGGMKAGRFLTEETKLDANGEAVMGPNGQPVKVTRLNMNLLLGQLRQSWDRDKNMIEAAVLESNKTGATRGARVAVPMPYDEQFLTMMGSAATMNAIQTQWLTGLTMDGMGAANLVHNGNVLQGYRESIEFARRNFSVYLQEMDKKAQQDAFVVQELTKRFERPPTQEEIDRLGQYIKNVNSSVPANRW